MSLGISGGIPFSLAENIQNLGRYLKRAKFVLLPNPYGPTGLLRARFNDAVFISLRRGYLFASNEKVANSTLRATFQSLEFGGRLPLHYKPFKRWTGPLLQPSDIFAFTDVRLSKNLKAFCVVRNPYARLVSCYRDKLEGRVRGRGYDRMARELGIAHPREGISFDAFVRAIGRQTQWQMNAHWRPQFFNIFMDMITYDEIIRFEEFGKRLCGLVAEFYPELGTAAADAIISQKRQDKSSDMLLDNYFNADLASVAQEIYRLDFDVFGYDRNLKVAASRPAIP